MCWFCWTRIRPTLKTTRDQPFNLVPNSECWLAVKAAAIRSEGRLPLETSGRYFSHIHPQSCFLLLITYLQNRACYHSHLPSQFACCPLTPTLTALYVATHTYPHSLFVARSDLPTQSCLLPFRRKPRAQEHAYPASEKEHRCAQVRFLSRQPSTPKHVRSSGFSRLPDGHVHR